MFKIKLRALIVLQNSSWMGIARLPYALNKTGWDVASFSTEGSFLEKTDYVKKKYILDHPKNAFQKIIEAVNDFNPSILIPGCERTIGWFHDIARLSGFEAPIKGFPLLQSIIRASLGNSEFYKVTLSKNLMHNFAKNLGLRVPPQFPATTSHDAKLASTAMGYPVVLKGEHGCAGSSVRICYNESEIEVAHQALLAANPRQRIDVQKYIDGDAAMCTGIVKGGRLLDSFFALKLHTYPLSTSPCSVAKLGKSEEAQSILSTLVDHLEFNGFCSCDFIVEKGTQIPYLLEFNPRPTPISAVGHVFGHDLCLALAQAQGHTSDKPIIPQARHDTVALFPNEWMRDHQSPYFNSAYHDVPWNDPRLLKAYIDYVTR